MAILVADGAAITCSMGTTPSLLNVLPGPPHAATAPAPAVPLAIISDFLPGTNILPFGMCISPANPAVQAARAASDDPLAPGPCTPATAGPWAPPLPVAVSGVPAFDQKATCRCTWQGIITVENPGQAIAATVP
jgi:hypothetical protein